MLVEIKIPSPGESITEVIIASWLVSDGAIVSNDQELVEIESDKATLALNAPADGQLQIKVGKGTTVSVGDVIGYIDTDKADTENIKSEKKTEIAVAVLAKEEETHTRISPLARKKAESENIDINLVISWLMTSKKRIAENEKDLHVQLSDVEEFIKISESISAERTEGVPGREVIRKKMSPLRKKLSERLVAVKNETAMLTTFNEIDMSAIIAIRKKHGEAFKALHGYSLGFVSFFASACAIAIRDFPEINGRIEGDEIVFPQYVDINIAVSSPKGLITPIIRNAEKMKIAELEKAIKDYGSKAALNRISPADLGSGTFTISNGGVFGSMMSAPLLNPPQSAILGLHKIIERPVAIEGKVVIRPMMYVALSYDHRLVDGKESVGFVVRIKELLENPVLEV